MQFKLAARDLTFADNAPFRFDESAEVSASASDVFEVFADIESWPNWFGNFKWGRWTSPAPHGLGSTRLVRVGPLQVGERFLAWDPGRRFTYLMTDTNLPVVRAMLADWQLDELGPDRTRVRFSICYDLPLLLRPAHPLLKARFASMPGEGIDGLKPYVEQ